MLLRGIAYIIEGIPLGQVSGIECTCRHRRVRRNRIQHRAEAVIIGGIGLAVLRVFCRLGQDLSAKAGSADAQRQHQGRDAHRVILQIRQVHRHQVKQAGRGAIGVLEEDIVLVLVITHQIHQNIGDQQDQPFIAAGQQRDARQRHQGQANELQFLLVNAFKNRFHRAQQHRFDHRDQRGGTVINKIVVAVGHHTVTAGGKVGCDRQKIGNRGHQQCRAGDPFPFFVLRKNAANQQPQGDDRHVNGCVLLDHHRQRREYSRQRHVLSVDAV